MKINKENVNTDNEAYLYVIIKTENISIYSLPTPEIIIASNDNEVKEYYKNKTLIYKQKLIEDFKNDKVGLSNIVNLINFDLLLDLDKPSSLIIKSMKENTPKKQMIEIANGGKSYFKLMDLCLICKTPISKINNENIFDIMNIYRDVYNEYKNKVKEDMNIDEYNDYIYRVNAQNKFKNWSLNFSKELSKIFKKRKKELKRIEMLLKK